MTTIECKDEFGKKKFNETMRNPLNIRKGEQEVTYPDEL